MSRRRLFFIALWIAGWSAVTWLMLMPVPYLPADIDDKLAHFASYLLLSSLPFSFCTGQRGLALAAALTLLLGSALEYAQSFVPDRTFELADMAANGVGTLTGYALAATLLFLGARRASRPF